MASAFHIACSDSVGSGGLARLNLQAKEFGELSISHPPERLDPQLIKAAEELLPWEQQQQQQPVDDRVLSSSSSWQGGEHWFVTRKFLVDMWVLPRDMSNGAWEEYAIAATKGEQKILQQVPQLLRLDSSRVVESAKTVLKDPLHLPPALLRKEPILLAMEPTRLKGAWKNLLKETPQQDVKSLMERCKETPQLLVEAATKWIDPNLLP